MNIISTAEIDKVFADRIRIRRNTTHWLIPQKGIKHLNRIAFQEGFMEIFNEPPSVENVILYKKSREQRKSKRDERSVKTGITQKLVYVTSFGQEFATLQEAEQSQAVFDLSKWIRDKADCYLGQDVRAIADALLKHYTLTPK